MNEFFMLMQMDFIESVREKVNRRHDEMNPSFTDLELSRLIYREHLSRDNKDLIAAHIQSIKRQLDVINSENFLKKDEILLEFSKSITLFDRFTGALQIDGGTYGDNFIASQNFYLDAVSACKKYVPNFYQGSMEFSCIPLKLRLAIEIYFKNMIGYVSSSQEFLTGNRKGKITLYPLSIADLLNFFSDEEYGKYCKLPVDIKILKDINFWSNTLIHTGIISFAWQNLQAIEFLKPLFSTKHENGSIHIEGFNYLSPGLTQDNLEKDLNKFLSNNSRKVSVEIFRFSNKPFEGKFYYARNVENKSE